MKEFTNWRTTLEEIIDGSIRVGPNEWDWLVNKSFKWPECACGELCKALPKGERGEPKDRALTVMGGEFHRFILRQQWSEALATYNAIEARTAKLLGPILVKELEESFDRGEDVLPYFDPTKAILVDPKQNFIVEQHNQIQ